MVPGPDQGASKRRARPQLDVPTIMDAALRLSGGGTLEPLTVRSLGKELGADPTAIYRHFRDKEELVLAVLDQLIQTGLQTIDPDDDWRTRLTRMAERTLAAFRAHPSIGATAGSNTTGGPGELAAIEMILVAMKEAGLGRQDAVRFYGVLSSYVISFASSQAASVLAGSSDADPAWISGSRSLQSSEHATILEVRDELEALRDSRRLPRPVCRSSWTRSRHARRRRGPETRSGTTKAPTSRRGLCSRARGGI